MVARLTPDQNVLEAIAQWLMCRPVGLCKGIYSYQDNNVSTGAMVTTGYRFETTAQH